MITPSLFPILAVIIALASDEADREKTYVPYDDLSTTMKIVNDTAVKGVICTPYYIKAAKQDSAIDIGVVTFLIRDKNGKNQKRLKLVSLDSIAKKQGDGARFPNLSAHQRALLKNGFTHLIWVPKNIEKYGGGEIIVALPKGTLIIAHGDTLGRPAPPHKRY